MHIFKKTLSCLFAAMLAGTLLIAQTPDEIIARMNQEQKRFDSEGMSMIMEIKFPIIGTFGTTIYMLGDKYKMITEVKGNLTTHWSDGVTDWEYDSSDNEITIEKAKPSGKGEAESNMKMLEGVTDGYDVKLTKETDEAWYFHCKKSKSNKDKSDLKAMDLVVSKATYLPLSVKAKENGITVILRDFAVGVSEKDVTFDQADYPGAKIVDKR